MSSGTAIAAQACPTCRRTLNRTTEPPRIGLLVVCMHCAAPLRFTADGFADLALERVELEALADAEADVMRAAINTARRQILARRARWN